MAYFVCKYSGDFNSSYIQKINIQPTSGACQSVIATRTWRTNVWQYAAYRYAFDVALRTAFGSIFMIRLSKLICKSMLMFNSDCVASINLMISFHVYYKRILWYLIYSVNIVTSFAFCPLLFWVCPLKVFKPFLNHRYLEFL